MLFWSSGTLSDTAEATRIADEGAQAEALRPCLRPLRQEFLQRERVRLLRRIARRDTGELRRLEMPRAARRQAPGAVAGVGGVPAHRLVLDVHHLIVGVEELDAVPVGIAEIDEQRMAGAVPAGPMLEIAPEAERARDIA